MAQTNMEKAQDAAELLRLKLKLVAEDKEIQKLQAQAATTRALNSAGASHTAKVVDFDTGNALTRAVNSYRVKRSVADMAKAEGRTISGAAIVPAAPADLEEAPASA